jgi:propionyl-CoA carboxylase beta chain
MGAKGAVDWLIMPHSTRRRVVRALQVLRNKHFENCRKKHDNLAL